MIILEPDNQLFLVVVLKRREIHELSWCCEINLSIRIRRNHWFLIFGVPILKKIIRFRYDGRLSLLIIWSQNMPQLVLSWSIRWWVQERKRKVFIFETNLVNVVETSFSSTKNAVPVQQQKTIIYRSKIYIRWRIKSTYVYHSFISFHFSPLRILVLCLEKNLIPRLSYCKFFTPVACRYEF